MRSLLAGVSGREMTGLEGVLHVKSSVGIGVDAIALIVRIECFEKGSAVTSALLPQ